MTNHITNMVDELNSAWSLLFPAVPPPQPHQWALWVTLHGQTIVRQSVAKVALRYKRSNDLQTPESLYKFTSGLMGKLSRENNNPK